MSSEFTNTNMQGIRVKICGITDLETAQYVAQHGADAIGLVFYEPSKRAVSLEEAAKIINHIPPFINIVGLFVNADSTRVKEVITNISIDILQFSGEEDPKYCGQFKKDYIKAIHASEDAITKALIYKDARGLLLDTFVPGQYGGTGKSFDWSLVKELKQHTNKPLILAGGLNAENVVQAISIALPYAVDVSSGVETDGIKDKQKISSFLENVVIASKKYHQNTM